MRLFLEISYPVPLIPDSGADVSYHKSNYVWAWNTRDRDGSLGLESRCMMFC